MSTFETRAEIALTYRPGANAVFANEPQTVENRPVHPGPPPQSKQRVFSKRIRKSHLVAKPRNDQSIAPLLETISALAVNSDCSGSEEYEYEETPSGSGLHPEDEDGVEDYDFETNAAQERLREEQGNSGFGNCHDDMSESTSHDLQQQHLVEDRASSALPLPANLSHRASDDLAPVNAFVVSESLRINRLTSSAVNRPRFDQHKSQWSPELNHNTAANTTPSVANNSHSANSGGGKCVRFNADVQVTAVSPRMSHKVVSAQTNQYRQQQYGPYRERHEFFRGPANVENGDPHEISSSVYDEVASSNSSASPQLYHKNSGAESNVNHRNHLRDMPTGELHRKVKKKLPKGDPSEPMYSNIDLPPSGQGDSSNRYQAMPLQQQQKSILKDPLCAKLRSAIRKGTFARSDQAQLESEIDALLYGNDNAKQPADNEQLGPSKHHHQLMNGQEKVACEIPFQADTLLGGLPSPRRVFKASKNSTTSKSSPNSKFPPNGRIATTSDSGTAPCNSYIQMIEEKYRNKESSTLAPNQTQAKLKGNKIASKGVKMQNKTLDGEGKSKLGKGGHSEQLGMTSFNVNSSSHFESPFLSHHSGQHQHQNMPMFRSTMDPLMSNILQESSSHSKVKERDTCKGKSASDGLGKGSTTTTAANSDSPNVKPKKPTRTMPANLNIPKDELYSFFADPVKGPSINLLMDELSRNFTSTASDTDSIRSGNSTLSKSLAENHIYEEILYECLEKQGHLGHSLANKREQSNFRANSPALYLPNGTPMVASTSNGLNISTFMASLTNGNGALLDTPPCYPHNV